MKFERSKLAGRAWHKYVIHFARHGNKTEHFIADAKAWAIENISGDWMVHVVSYDTCALFYLADDDDAILFELSQLRHPDDRRGKGVYG